MIWRARRKLAIQEALQIADRLHRREPGLAQVHLVTVLESAQQFHPVERSQIQISFQIGLLTQLPRSLPFHPRNQFGQRTQSGLPGQRRPPPRLHNFQDRAGSRLLRGSAREVVLRPEKPVPHLLVLGQSPVGAPYHRFGISLAIAHDYYRARLGVSVSRQRDHHALFHFRLAAQGGFEVFGIDIHAGGSDNYIFLASFEIQIACGVERAYVAGAVPAFFGRHGLQFVPAPISGGHSATADQDFSVRGQFDFAPGQYFANRSLAQPKGMIHADDRCGLGEPVALDGGVSQASPELFGHAVECGSAGNERPELPSELTMHPPEDPPAMEEMLPFRRLKTLLKLLQAAFALADHAQSFPSGIAACAVPPPAPTHARAVWCE